MCLSCQVYNKEEQLKSSIVFAREYLKETKISRDQLKYLCEEASRGGALTHRPNLITLTYPNLTHRLPGPPSGDHRGESGHRVRSAGRRATLTLNLTG